MLFGWAYDITALTQVLPGLTAMNPTTAVSLVIAAAAMSIHSKVDQKIIWAVSAAIISVGCLKLFQLAGAETFAIDQLLFAEKLKDAVGVPPNRMAPNTALALIITGLAIATSKSKIPRVVISSQVLSCASIAITLFAIIGYTLGIVSLYGIKAFTPMAVHTACGLLAVAVAVLSVNPGVGLMRIVCDHGPAGQLSRVMLPLVVLVPVIVGMLRLEGQKLGYYNTGTGVALQVFGNVLVTFSLLMISIVLLYRSDLARRNREFTVRRSEEEYRLAEELGRVGHWRLDLGTNQFECSAALRRICGLGEEERYTRDAISRLYKSEDALLESKVLERAALDGTGWDENRRLVRPDGEKRSIRSHGKVERGEAGKVVSIFGVFVDITELELSRQEAEAATAAKAEFVANMSHEIRTPLNSIIGFTDLLLEDVRLLEEHRRQLKLVKNSGGALLTVVNDILDFSKMEAGKIELVARPFDLAHLAQSTINIIRQSAEAKGLAITFEADRQLNQYFIGDEGRIRQVVLNLLSNAVKFTHDGSVTLSIKSSPAGLDADRVTLVVADTGMGIAPDQECRLFEKFSQANSSISRDHGGTGLGLAICKKLVELMSGEIGFRPLRSGGSEFWFSISLQPTDEPVAQRRAAPPTTARSQRILVVEDVAANQELAIAMLTRGGHEVEVASNGREAISAVQKQVFDLILMDIQMPIMDGMTATKLIRLLPGKARNIPIIALTANIMPEQIELFRSAGMNDHVSKPINIEELHLAIVRNTQQASPRQATGVKDTDPKDAAFDESAFRDLKTLLPAERLRIHSRTFRSAMNQLREFEAAVEVLKPAAHGMITQAGMFGFNKLSGLCRELEYELENDRSIGHLKLKILSEIAFATKKIDELQIEEQRRAG